MSNFYSSQTHSPSHCIDPWSHALAAPEGGRHPLLHDVLSRDILVELIGKVLKPYALVALLSFGISEISSLCSGFSL